jgi:hypothetical protein
MDVCRVVSCRVCYLRESEDVDATSELGVGLHLGAELGQLLTQKKKKETRSAHARHIRRRPLEVGACRWLGTWSSMGQKRESRMPLPISMAFT